MFAVPIPVPPPEGAWFGVLVIIGFLVVLGLLVVFLDWLMKFCPRCRTRTMKRSGELFRCRSCGYEVWVGN